MIQASLDANLKNWKLLLKIKNRIWHFIFVDLKVTPIHKSLNLTLHFVLISEISWSFIHFTKRPTVMFSLSVNSLHPRAIYNYHGYVLKFQWHPFQNLLWRISTLEENLVMTFPFHTYVIESLYLFRFFCIRQRSLSSLLMLPLAAKRGVKGWFPIEGIYL